MYAQLDSFKRLFYLKILLLQKYKYLFYAQLQTNIHAYLSYAYAYTDSILR